MSVVQQTNQYLIMCGMYAPGTLLFWAPVYRRTTHYSLCHHVRLCTRLSLWGKWLQYKFLTTCKPNGNQAMYQLSVWEPAEVLYFRVRVRLFFHFLCFLPCMPMPAPAITSSIIARKCRKCESLTAEQEDVWDGTVRASYMAAHTAL